MFLSAKSGSTNFAGCPVFSIRFARIRILAMFVLFGMPAWGAETNEPQDTLRHLVERIAAIPGLHGSLRLEWHASPGWSEAESEQWQELFESECSRRSVVLSGELNAPVLVIRVEQTPSIVVITARTLVADREEVRIVSVARSVLPPSILPVSPIRIDRQMIYESPDRILDASSLWNGAEGGLALLLYRNFEVVAIHLDQKGEVKQSISLSSAALKPTRDPHADLVAKGNSASAQLWGKVCDFSWESTSDVRCHAEKPVGASKNTGRAATLLTSPCDANDWKLVVSSNEGKGKDVLQIIPDGSLQENSAALVSEFPGPILKINGEQNPSGALVVSRNLRTGNYEVYELTLACGN